MIFQSIFNTTLRTVRNRNSLLLIMKSLKAKGNKLSEPAIQLKILTGTRNGSSVFEKFEDKIANLGYSTLKPLTIDTLQINVGKMCNQTCEHCHVDAGPDRKEIMTRETMLQCLYALNHPAITTVDLTGGAPEMNPDFKWFVSQIRALGKHVMVRSNLTILVANLKNKKLPQFFSENEVEVVSSLPCYTAENTDKQRGDGVFESSIEALKMLNKVGYGQTGSGLMLNLVYNPLGAFLPPDQATLEKDYKKQLSEKFGITFNSLYAITNLPISRFLDYLLNTNRYEKYMNTLIENFNPQAIEGVMCRNLVSVGWDGFLYDCDFNQMLEMKVETKMQHISNFSYTALTNRSICLSQHCYGCTAGAGSSCGGEVVK